MDAVDSAPRSKKIKPRKLSATDGPPLPGTGDNQQNSKPKDQEGKSNVFEESYSNLLGDIKTAKRHIPLVKSETKDNRGVKTIKTVHTTYFPDEPVAVSEKEQKIIEHDVNRFKMHFPKGVFTVINMTDFHTKASRDIENGDAEKLIELFLDLGFIVQRFDNPSSNEIDQIVDAASKCNFDCDKCQSPNKYCGASVCAVLSHGNNQKFSSKDGEMKIQRLVEKFRQTGLSDKPKVFIFQTSDEIDSKEANQPHDSVDLPGNGSSSSEYRMTLPAEADFLYIYSTTPGQVSWRDEERGSWFIHHLDEVFRKDAEELSILRMLIKVNRMVKEDWEKFISKSNYKDNKQVPSFICQLRKDLYFNSVMQQRD